MKATVLFDNTVAILFSSILFLAGCGGTSNLSSSAPPAPPTSGASSAHGTFIYVRNDNSRTGSDGSISGFRMDPDGILTALQGSPFSINGNLAVSGSFLIVADFAGIISYGIDPSSGSLTPLHTVAASGSSALYVDPIAVDSKNIYRGGELSPSQTTVIYGFSIDDNGSFAALSGSPFLFSGPGFWATSIGVQNSMLFASGDSFKSSGLDAYNIQDGALVNRQALSTGVDWNLAVHPSGRVAYAVNGSEIESFTIDAHGVLSQDSSTGDSSGNFQAVAIDPTGKFLAAIDHTSPSPTDSRIAVFSIDPVTTGLTELGTPVSTGEPGGNSITFDPIGRFILVTHGGISPNPNDVMVFSFDPASGTVTKTQSAPTGNFPGSVVIATF